MSVRECECVCVRARGHISVPEILQKGLGLRICPAFCLSACLSQSQSLFSRALSLTVSPPPSPLASLSQFKHDACTLEHGRSRAHTPARVRKAECPLEDRVTKHHPKVVHLCECVRACACACVCVCVCVCWGSVRLCLCVRARLYARNAFPLPGAARR